MARVHAACLGSLLLIALVSSAVTKPCAAAGDDGPLARFHAAMEDYQRAVRAGVSRRVTVLQIGDSHTAGDHFAERMRTLFQGRYGNGGRGQLAPGVPYRFFDPYRVEVFQTDGWEILNIRRDEDPGPFGLTGFRLVGRGAQDRIRLTAEESARFDRVEIEFLRRPGGGRMRVSVDGTLRATVSTKGEGRRPDRLVLPVAPGSREVEIGLLGDGPVELLSWSTQRGASGLVYAAHGIEGAQLTILDRMDRDILAWQLRHLDPAMVVLAFGTNEGFESRLDLDQYEITADQILRRIRRLLPDAAIVIATAPDALYLPSFCARGRRQRGRVRCALLPDAVRDDYVAALDRQDRTLCRWHEPPNVQAIRDIHARLAERYGAFFWDWSVDIPGGTCGIDAWARRDPPLAFHDRVHLRPEGYARSAEALFRRIMQAR